MKKSLKKNKKGFTLVEMIVVIAIIGVLAAMMVPALLGFVDKAHESNMNAVAAGLGRGVDAVLFEPKWSDLEGATYESEITRGVPTGFTCTSAEPINIQFADELKKIAGDGYEDSGKIYITINKKTATYPTLQNVVYGVNKTSSKDGTGVVFTANSAVSSKEVGVYGQPTTPATP